MLRVRMTVGIALAVAGLTGCATSMPDRVEPVGYPPGTIVDYQLGGGYDPAPGVGGVARDSTDSPAAGLYNICYVNGFQSQPGEGGDWLAERPDLVLSGPGGAPLIDPNWPDEYILDTSTAERRAGILDAVAPAIERCAASGFDAVEIDNLDSYSRSNGALTIDDAVALAEAYADLAHGRGLAIAQKNTGELGAAEIERIGFDFAVVEECYRFDECAVYSDLYGDSVIDIEYADDLRGAFTEACDDPDAAASTILRDRGLGMPGADGYVFERC